MRVIHFIRINRAIHMSGFLSVFLFVVLSGLTIIPLVYHTDATEAAPGTATESTLSLDIANATASVDLTVSSTNGTFAASTANNEASFSVTTNNYTGYTLSISAADDTGTLDNGDYNLSSIASNLTESEFNTTTNNGKWGYKPSKYYVNNEVVDNTGEDSVFLSSPTTEATTLDVTSTANNEANSYTIGLGARADYSSSAGTYTKTFTLTAVGNPNNYSITYNANAGTDTVTNMPYESTNNIQTGDTSSTTITLSNLVPVREHYSFLGWCSGTVTTTDGVDSCSTGAAIYNPNGDGTNLIYGIDQTILNDTTIYAMWEIDSFAQTTQARYQNADGTWGSYSTVDTKTVNYGSSYSWSTSHIPGFNTAMYQSASVSSYTVTTTKNNQVSIYRKTFTCTKQYRLQNADGSYPSSYTNDGTVTAYYGGSCSYSKSVDYYTAQSASRSNVTSAQTLQVSLPRTTYSLTVNRNTTYISSVSGAGTYRWGQAVSISATPSSGNEFTTWSQTAGTTGTFGSTTSASTTFTMPKSAATIYANGQILSMQNLSAEKCTTAGVTVRDTRDGEMYLVRKLPDGRCWMQDNLRLDLTSVSLANLKGKTNASDTILGYLKNGGGSSPYTSTAVRSITSGSGTYNTPIIVNSQKNTTATVRGQGSNKVGIYYNFCAATAGSYCYASGSGSGSASSDICPSGWRIPTGGSSGEYQVLYNKTGTSSFNSEFSTIFSGNYWAGNGGVHGINTFMYVWASNYYGSSNMYSINVTVEGNYRIPDNDDRSRAITVRCILK